MAALQGKPIEIGLTRFASLGDMKSCGQEDVKKLVSLSFRDFIFDPKCLPTSQRSPIRHPGAIVLSPSSLQIWNPIFSHLPDGTGTLLEMVKRHHLSEVFGAPGRRRSMNAFSPL
jgi:hypothetical protein